jgi:hypothetical protein
MRLPDGELGQRGRHSGLLHHLAVGVRARHEPEVVVGDDHELRGVLQACTLDLARYAGNTGEVGQQSLVRAGDEGVIGVEGDDVEVALGLVPEIRVGEVWRPVTAADALEFFAGLGATG